MIAGIGGRQAAYDQLLEQPPMEVWQHWQTLFEQNEVSELTLVNHALAQRLQQVEDQKVYEAINERLQQADLPNERKAWLVALLTEVATPAALDILLDAAINQSDAELRNTALDGIRQMGDRRWDGRFHPELSPALETTWSQAGAMDAGLLTALALTMAKLGAPSGVEQLMETVDGSGKALQDIDQEHDPRAYAAVSALEAIRNPDAIAVLAKWFQTFSLGETTFEASGEALAAMGLPEATKVLLKWAKQAPDDAASLAGKWLGEVRDTESAQLLHEAASQGETFRSEQVKQKLVESVKMLGSAAEYQELGIKPF
jgi:hypothetical protein